MDCHHDDALRISVALATYQGERYLEHQLASLAEQTKLPAELVIGDDMSTDGTVEIIRRFADTAPFPVLLRCNTTRLGFRENFMQTAERCSGDLIAFCDQDDVWHPDKLERCAHPFADEEVTLVCHDANVIDSDGHKINRSIVVREGGTWAPSLRPLNSQYALTMVFRRSLTQHHDLWLQTIDENTDDPTQHAAHDPWFYFLGVTLGTVCNIDEPLLDYRQHGGNVIGVPGIDIDRSNAFRTEYYRLRFVAVGIRLRLLHELRNRAAPKFRRLIDTQIPVYQKHIQIYKARSRAYGGGTLASRFTGLVQAALAGAYARSGFGIHSMASDFLFGLIRFEPGTRFSRIYTSVFRRG